MHPRAFLPVTLVAGLALSLAAACSAPDPVSPGLDAAKVGPQGGATPTVDATDPTQAPQDTTLDVAVLGSNYDQGSKADFLLDGNPTQKVKTNRTTFVSSTKLVANITIAIDAVVAGYDVQVTTSRGKKGIGIEKFAVTQRTPPGQFDPPILTVTMGQGSTGTDAVRADDAANSPYVEAAHIVINGNLSFWLGNTGNPRSVVVTTTAFSGSTQDRIFTNTHTNPGGDDSLGMLGMVPGTSGTAVFVVELGDDPNQSLRYGTDCTDSFGNVVPATKATTTRSADGRTWTITGTTGVHCKKLGKKPGFSQIGTAGPFSMTLVQVSP